MMAAETALKRQIAMEHFEAMSAVEVTVALAKARPYVRSPRQSLPESEAEAAARDSIQEQAPAPAPQPSPTRCRIHQRSVALTHLDLAIRRRPETKTFDGLDLLSLRVK